MLLLETFIQQLINGLSLGSVYALIAVGYSLVYSVLLFSNFAHGGFLVIGGYICYYALRSGGANIWIASFAALVGAGISAIVVERLAYRPIRERTPITLYMLIASMGMSIVIENIFVVTVGGRFRALPPVIPTEPVNFLGLATTSAFDILSLVTAVVFLAGLQLFLVKVDRWEIETEKLSHASFIRELEIDYLVEPSVKGLVDMRAIVRRRNHQSTVGLHPLHEAVRDVVVGSASTRGGIKLLRDV